MRLFISLFVMTALAVDLSGAVYESYLDPHHPLDRKIIQLREKIAKDPKNPTWHNDLGVALMQKNFPKDAMRAFKDALKLDKTFYSAWFNLGLYYEVAGHKFKAYRCFKKTLKHKPGHDLALFHLGYLLEKWGFKQKAIKHYAKAFYHNQVILDPGYNALILYTKLMPEVFDYYYRKYKNPGLMPFEKTPPRLSKVYKKAPEKKPKGKKKKVPEQPAKKVPKKPEKPVEKSPKKPVGP